MQTRTYGDLYKLVQSLAGVKAFAPTEQDDIANFINRRFYTAYNTSQAWPRYLIDGEERKLSSFKTDTRLASSNYNNVYYYKQGEDANGNAIYKANNRNLTSQSTTIFTFNNSTKKWFWAAATSTKDPITDVISISSGLTFATQQDTDEYTHPLDVKDWGTVGTLTENQLHLIPETVVLYDENKEEESTNTALTMKDTIGEFIRIHRSKPFVKNSVAEYNFFIDEDGAHVLDVRDTDSSKVFVTYKKKFTQFDVTSDYTTSTVVVPLEFFAYIAHGAYADFLTMDGQSSKAIAESERADQHLFKELERLDIINNNNFPVTKFSTYVNQQSR
tara:strand:- start:645 stop:1637 length:993 start_codon:yes stop_codon:yes gene_type:complete